MTRASRVAHTVAAGWIDVGACVSAAALAVATAVVRPSGLWVSIAIVSVVLAGLSVVVTSWWWPRSQGRRTGAVAVGSGPDPADADDLDPNSVAALRDRPQTARYVAAVLGVAVCAAAGSLVAVLGVAYVTQHRLDDIAASARVDGGGTVCRVLTRGTPASRTASDATAAGDLADRLRAGAALDAGLPGAAACAPTHVGVVAAGSTDAEIVASVRLTLVGGGALDRDLTARLLRVHDRWAVTSVGVA